MKERIKVQDHVDVLVLVSFDELIQNLKETRRAILKKYPEAKRSEIRISVGPFNHCVHVDFLRYATEDEINEMEKRREEIRKDVEAFSKSHPFGQEDIDDMLD